MRGFVLSILIFPSLLWAQTSEERVVPSGTVRWMMENSRQIVQAGKDTTKGVFIAGVDEWSTFVQYILLNDSANVKVYLDISPDNQTFIAWSAGAIDSALVAKGGGSTTTHYVQFTNPPNDKMFARVRVVGAHAAGDSVKVTIKWVLTWLPVAFNP